MTRTSKPDASASAAPSPPASPSEAERPRTGGSYIRQPNGSLKRKD